MCERERKEGGMPRTRRGEEERASERERAIESKESRASKREFLFLTSDEPDGERVGHLGGGDRSLEGARRVDVAQEEVLVGQGRGSERAAVVLKVLLRRRKKKKK